MCAYFYMFECFKQAFYRKPEVSIEDISAYMDRAAEFMQLWKKARHFAGSRLPIPSLYARHDPASSYRPNPMPPSAVPTIAPSIAAKPSSIPVLSSRGKSGALRPPVNASRRNVKVPAKASKQVRPSNSNSKIPVPSSVASGHKKPQKQAGTSKVPVPARRCGTPAPVPQRQQQQPRRTRIPPSKRFVRGSDNVSSEKGKQKAATATPAQSQCRQIPKPKGILRRRFKGGGKRSCRGDSNPGRRVAFCADVRVEIVDKWIEEAWPERKIY